MKIAARHWIEPLQILEKISCAEGLRAFVHDGLECGFSRPEIAELYGTYFEDRLAEALALAVAAGDYGAAAEFGSRLAEILHAPDRLFKSGQAGAKSLPVDRAYQRCFREALLSIEGSFHRYVEGDYPAGVPVSRLLREGHAAMLAGNLARAFDRVTVAGARALEGEYLARPTEWLETDPFYSWLLGIERVSHVVRHLAGWPGGRHSEWAAQSRKVGWHSEGLPHAELTRARRDVLRLLRAERFAAPELARMRRNRRWIGPELLSLLRMPDDDTTPTVIRNAVRSLGAVGFRPAVDDLLGLLMRAELDDDGTGAGLAGACQDALAEFGPAIKGQLLHHFDLALVDTQRLALAGVLARLPADDEVMRMLEHLAGAAEEMRHRVAVARLVAGYAHPRAKTFLKAQLSAARQARHTELQRALTPLVKPRTRKHRKAVS